MLLLSVLDQDELLLVESHLNKIGPSQWTRLWSTGIFESFASVFKSLETVRASKFEECSGKTGNLFHKHKHATAHPKGFPVRWLINTPTGLITYNLLLLFRMSLHFHLLILGRSLQIFGHFETYDFQLF